MNSEKLHYTRSDTISTAAMVAGGLAVLCAIGLTVKSCAEAWRSNMQDTTKEVLARSPHPGELCLRLTVQPGQNLGDIASQFQGIVGSGDNQHIIPELEATRGDNRHKTLMPGDTFAACATAKVVDPAKLSADQYIVSTPEAVKAYQDLHGGN